MPIIKVDVTLEEWLSAPEWQRDKTNRGRLMIVAKEKPVGQSIADVRKQAWKTRREKYGQRGHSGAYSHPRPVYTARWNERLNSMTDVLIRLYREGVLSEGQVSKDTGLDRVSCRNLAIRQAEAEHPIIPSSKPGTLPK